MVELPHKLPRVKDNPCPKVFTDKHIAQPNEVPRIIAINVRPSLNFNGNQCAVAAFQDNVHFVASILAAMSHLNRMRPFAATKSSARRSR